VVNHLNRVGKKTLGERIIDEKIRYAQQMRGARMFGPIALQSAKIIRIAKLASKLFENLPVCSRSRAAYFADEMAWQIRCNSIVIEQRVVYIEQENNASRRSIAFHFFQ